MIIRDKKNLCRFFDERNFCKEIQCSTCPIEKFKDSKYEIKGNIKLDKTEEFIFLFEYAEKILESDLEWEKKYEIIFSTKLYNLFHVSYYDPDMDYEDDVIAFMNAYREKYNELKETQNV